MLPEQAKLWFAPTSPPTAILQKFLLNRAEFVGRSNGSTWWRKTAGTSRWETCFEKIEGLFWALLSQSRWANSRLELVAFLLPPEQPSWHQGTAEQLRKDSGYDRPACITRALFFFFFGCTVGHAELPDQGANLRPLQWKHRILTTGPPGKPTRALFAMIVANCFPDKTLWHGPCHLELVCALYGGAGQIRQWESGFVWYWGSCSWFRSHAFSGSSFLHFWLTGFLNPELGKKW